MKIFFLEGFDSELLQNLTLVCKTSIQVAGSDNTKARSRFFFSLEKLVLLYIFLTSSPSFQTVFLL